MVFQNYALIDSVTVRKNIGFPLIQNTDMTLKEIDKLVDELLILLELPNTVTYYRVVFLGMKKELLLHER